MKNRRFPLSIPVLFIMVMLITLEACGGSGATQDSERTESGFDWSDYSIVVPVEGLPVVNTIMEGTIVYLSEVKNAIAAVSGTEPRHIRDTAPETPREVIIGQTSRPESAALSKKYHERDYVVAYHEGKYVVWGGSEEALVSAIKEFIALIPGMPQTPADGDLVCNEEDFIPVFINGTDLKQYSFSSTQDFFGTSQPQNTMKYAFYEKYGYSLKIGGATYEFISDTVNREGVHYIIFGRGEGFCDTLPEVGPGTAAILYNGSSLMIYSGDEQSERTLYKYLFQLFDAARTENGKKMVELEPGVTYMTLAE